MSLEKEQQLESTYVMPTFARKRVELVRGSGMYAYDDKEKAYLDFIAGIGVLSLGHCHPALVEALSEQAEKLIHVGNYYYIENRGEVAAMVSELLGTSESSQEQPAAWKSFFANSGAEANECAIKLARLYAKQKGRKAQTIITLERSFHGRTLATLAATAQPAKQEAFQPLPEGFIHVPINDVAALEDLFDHEGDSICAIMLECVQGESGVHPCSKEFLVAAERLAHEHGALLIVDEIQTGIYRCGRTPFAFQHFGIEPDIVTIAKGIASGFPTGMCSARGVVADTFSPGDHGSTFGGSNLAIAAINATLGKVTEESFGTHIEEVGAYLREQLSTLPHVVEVRGLGLMNACDLEEPLSAFEVVDKGIEAGMLLNATGPQTLRFLPPLICEKHHIDEMIGKLRPLLDF